MERIEIKGRDVLKCTLIEKGIVQKNTEEGSKNHGQTYSRYSLQGMAIAVDDRNDFAKDHKAGSVYSIDVMEGPSPDDVEKTVWSFAGYTTTNAEIKMAETESKLFSFTAVAKDTVVTEELLAKLKDAQY